MFIWGLGNSYKPSSHPHSQPRAVDGPGFQCHLYLSTRSAHPATLHLAFVPSQMSWRHSCVSYTYPISWNWFIKCYGVRWGGPMCTTGNFPESLALGGAPDPLCQALAWTLGHSSGDERSHSCPPGKAGKKSAPEYSHLYSARVWSPAFVTLGTMGTR